MRVLICAVVLLAVLPAWASEPGEALHCDDWVAQQSGLTIDTFWPPHGTNRGIAPNRMVFDNEGRVVTVQYHENQACGGALVDSVQIVAVDSQGVETQLAALPGRCGARPGEFDMASTDADPWSTPGTTCFASSDADLSCVGFDPATGRLFFTYVASCRADIHHNPPCYGASQKLCVLDGLTTLLDIEQTYAPDGTAGFYVPLRPEGLHGADWFDTYWGDLATVGDWSQAQGLQCDYPTESPSSGDYLTVVNTLPTPTPGNGYYYVTSVTHQGATRYGRKKIGGVITGRDPAVLPVCSESKGQ